MTINQTTQSDPNVPSVFVYMNRSSAVGNWVTIRLRDLASNSFNRRGIGAKVWVTAGGVQYRRELHSATTFRSQGPQYLHFGLGSATSITEIRVVWPDGVTKMISRTIGVNRDKKVTRKADGTMTVDDLP